MVAVLLLPDGAFDSSDFPLEVSFAPADSKRNCCTGSSSLVFLLDFLQCKQSWTTKFFRPHPFSEQRKSTCILTLSPTAVHCFTMGSLVIFKIAIIISDDSK